MVMTIGEIARRTGLPSSTIRYYEKLGVLPPPMRYGGQRRYDETGLGRIQILRATLASGFTLAEARRFIAGFPACTPPSARWKTLAAGKLKELAERRRQIARMQRLLRTSFDCRCQTLEDCARLIRVADFGGSPPRPSP